ncbi:MAG TPA: D-alanyl-D-alanine carboxypeptidase [Lachnospiraceae bacterium]|nr:D-alanyl-D-alanine carboxypeptidase [Lachnospiraceae bacterium]
MRDYDSEERLRRIQREKRREMLRRERKRRAMQKRMLVLGSVLGAIVLLAGAGIMLRGLGEYSKEKDKKEKDVYAQAQMQGPDLDGTARAAFAETEDAKSREEEKEESEIPFADGYLMEGEGEAASIDEEKVMSSYALLIDLDESRVVAQRGMRERISPASMTKILTVLVAAEHVTDLTDTFTITREITDYSYRNDCSAAGFGDGETVTVEDLFYGTILPSGADAAAGLAYYVSGSLEEFVVLMNEKIEELGLSESAHFTNCVGLYDENHYCTVYDMAVMLKAAVENDLCREVMSARRYTTSQTAEHPEGIELSNWFLRRIEDKDTKGEVVCAKTGFVDQSGSCAASYSISDSGKHYICVTANAHSSWRCIYDHVALYQEYSM